MRNDASCLETSLLSPDDHSWLLRVWWSGTRRLSRPSSDATTYSPVWYPPSGQKKMKGSTYTYALSSQASHCCIHSTPAMSEMLKFYF